MIINMCNCLSYFDHALHAVKIHECDQCKKSKELFINKGVYKF